MGMPAFRYWKVSVLLFHRLNLAGENKNFYPDPLNIIKQFKGAIR